MTTGVGHHQVIHGQGAQALRTVPVNAHGRPTVVTSATYRIVDLRLGEDDPLRELVPSGTPATIDATSTTTDAACGHGTGNARKIPVASTVGFVQGRTYLITLADGARESFVVEGISANDYLIPLYELSKQYASGATVRGLEVSGTFPALTADDDKKIKDDGGPYAIDWSWDLDPSPRREMVWIIRQPDSLLITEEDVLSIDASLSATSGNRVQISTAIHQAAAEIRVHLQLHSIDPGNFHAPSALRLAVAYRACWHLVRLMKGEENAARAETYQTEAQKYLDSITIGQPPEKSVKTNSSTDTAPGGTSKPYHHWQVLS